MCLFADYIEARSLLTARGLVSEEFALTLILLTWTIWRAPSNASKWRMGFNSAFKRLKLVLS